MKKLLAILTCVIAISACKGSTEYGECIGFQKDEEPGLKYEIDTRNAIVTAIFSGGVIWPVVWALAYAKCPVGRK